MEKLLGALAAVAPAGTAPAKLKTDNPANARLSASGINRFKNATDWERIGISFVGTTWARPRPSAVGR